MFLVIHQATLPRRGQEYSRMVEQDHPYSHTTWMVPPVVLAVGQTAVCASNCMAQLWISPLLFACGLAPCTVRLPQCKPQLHCTPNPVCPGASHGHLHSQVQPGSRCWGPWPALLGFAGAALHLTAHPSDFRAVLSCV